MSRAATSPDATWDALFSDFYLRAYASDAAAAEAETQALAAARLSGCPEGGELLDAPCGFGRHSIPLARAGYRVTGVDRSPALLADAERRATAKPRPEFVRADYRELPFADERFDAAVCLFTSLGYLGDEEDTNVLAGIRRVLRPDARLVLELMHRDLLVKRWSDTDWRLMGEGRLLLDQRTFDPTAGVATTTQTLVDSTGQRESVTWSVRVYTATEVLRMVERAGFSDAKAYGSLDGAPFAPDTRLILVAIR